MRPSKPPPPVLRAGPALAVAAPNHPLPAGMRDLLPPEAAQRRRLSRRLLDHFARMAATRLSDRPMPMRLCYEGTVLRRRQERARKHRQIPQAGLELIGAS